MDSGERNQRTETEAEAARADSEAVHPRRSDDLQEVHLWVRNPSSMYLRDDPMGHVRCIQLGYP